MIRPRLLISLFAYQVLGTSFAVFAAAPVTPARITTLTINPGEVVTLHLRPEFESTIHLPDVVSSVLVGNPATFKVEHNEGEPEYVYVKPATRTPAQSNLLISTHGGQHVTLELINDGSAASQTPVDFLLEFKRPAGFLVTESSDDIRMVDPEPTILPASLATVTHGGGQSAPATELEAEYRTEQQISVPKWEKWDNRQIQTSLGAQRQWANQIAVTFSIRNASDKAVEIVPPQVQIAGLKLKHKKKGVDTTSDQLEIRDYRLSSTRLEPGERADGAVLFDRPNYKQSAERVFLQIAEADKIDQPILVRLPFTPALPGSDQ